MADRLVSATMEAVLAERGLDADASRDAVGHVFAAIAAVLAAGKTVAIPGVGKLSAPEKPAFVASSCRRQARLQRKVVLKHGAIISQGEAYDVI